MRDETGKSEDATRKPSVGAELMPDVSLFHRLAKACINTARL